MDAPKDNEVGKRGKLGRGECLERLGVKFLIFPPLDRSIDRKLVKRAFEKCNTLDDYAILLILNFNTGDIASRIIAHR